MDVYCSWVLVGDTASGSTLQGLSRVFTEFTEHTNQVIFAEKRYPNGDYLKFNLMWYAMEWAAEIELNIKGKDISRRFIVKKISNCGLILFFQSQKDCVIHIHCRNYSNE